MSFALFPPALAHTFCSVEKARISAAGGYIEYGRVNGNLALSRALGDFDFKKNYNVTPQQQVITADPDVTCHEITEEDEFLIIACDGCVSFYRSWDLQLNSRNRNLGLLDLTTSSGYCSIPSVAR